VRSRGPGLAPPGFLYRCAVPELSIIMPVFNERGSVEEAVRGVLEADYPVEDFELVVVDDGSTDGTREFLLANSWPSQVRVIAHDRNRGKGVAIRTGLREVRGTWTVTMDSDLEYDPADLGRVLQPVLDDEVDASMGVRAFGAHTAYSFWYVLGGKMLTLLANMLYNSWITDMMACQKAMRTELFRSLPLREDGFGIETEIVMQLLLRGARIQEIPVAYSARTREEGKKLQAIDGLRVLRTVVRCRIAGTRPPIS
jgi:glycosyltransferase involved in cell wall biosynthesis